jgi:hypothetical protein
MISFIVAAIDITTCETTGSDDPAPNWAGGLSLEKIKYYMKVCYILCMVNPKGNTQ